MNKFNFVDIVVAVSAVLTIEEVLVPILVAIYMEEKLGSAILVAPAVGMVCMVAPHSSDDSRSAPNPSCSSGHRFG